MRKIIFITIAFISITTYSQTASKRVSEFNLDKKVAIKGYDPVAYFTQKKAIKGTSNLASTYKGIIYYFSTQSNKDTFEKNPASYEPQYGGWCAYAMGDSCEKVEINPNTFKIINGKLYLFYNAFFNNTLKSWNKDEITLNKKADANWEKTLNN